MNKIILISISMALSLATAIPACSQPPAPAKPAATAPAAQTSPAKPVDNATSSAQPQQPATPPQPRVEKPTSFESATFSSDKYGLSIKYPKSWIKKEVSGDFVFTVARTEEMVADTLLVRVIPKASDPVAAINDTLTQYPGFKGFTGGAKLDSSAPTTFGDSRISATEARLTLKVLSYTIHIYGLAMDRVDNTIVVMGFTAGEVSQQDLLKEIAQTITFK
jgi:hypothetical protein